MKPGTRVAITGGSYQGHTGTVVRRLHPGAVFVEVDGATRRCSECGGDKSAVVDVADRFLVDTQQELRLEEAS